MLMPKEVSDTSERQVVTHDYIIPNFSVFEAIEELKEFRGLL